MAPESNVNLEGDRLEGGGGSIGRTWRPLGACLVLLHSSPVVMETVDVLATCRGRVDYWGHIYIRPHCLGASVGQTISQERTEVSWIRT